MNRLVKLSLLLSVLVSGACNAQEICKSVCAQEKRECVYAATKWEDRGAESMKTDKHRMARDFGNGSVQTNQPVGPAASNAADRKMVRKSQCDDKHMTCAKACVIPAADPVSSVLVKPAAK